MTHTGPIRKLLVANRGEIALRVIRTARELGITTVALFSDADEHGVFVAAADEAVRLPGTAAADTYLRVDAVVAAALRTGADAVHPGYGFLSENPSFARACLDAGVRFVGPPAEVIERMGSKIEAKLLMEQAGVPVLPGVTVEEGQTEDTLAKVGEEIGFPLLVKAAFGGGGRGMRVVASGGELAAAVDGARREAASAFGDGTVFLEHFVEQPRHVEIQVFGDEHGDVVHLFERDCSIQRRHQKIVEESPSPAIDDVVRTRMCEAAVTAARAIGYVNAGTVEFVVAPTGDFWFLEVNTRLQVEHPVTEMVTGLDLVALQLSIAEGQPIPLEVRHASTRGHAIEARLYAEDVMAGYRPATGRLDRISIPTGDGVRVDTGYRDGSLVSPHYDAMLAKVVVWAPTREAATRRLIAALRVAEIHGPPTNRDLLVRVLEHEEWAAGATDTAFLDRNAERCEKGIATGAVAETHAIAAAIAARAAHRAASPMPTGIPAGWRNVGPAQQPVRYRVGDREVTVQAADETHPQVMVDGDPREVSVLEAEATRVDVEVGGTRHAMRVHRVDDTVYVDSALGSSRLEELPRFPLPERADAPGSLLAPLPGTIVHVSVAVGDTVSGGDALLALEAMKMEHTIRAPHDGRVSEVLVATGDQVETGAVLVVVEPIEPPDAEDDA